MDLMLLGKNFLHLLQEVKHASHYCSVMILDHLLELMGTSSTVGTLEQILQMMLLQGLQGEFQKRNIHPANLQIRHRWANCLGLIAAEGDLESSASLLGKKKNSSLTQKIKRMMGEVLWLH